MHLMVRVVVGEFVTHIADREDVNTARDERDHGKHDQRQAIDVIRQRNIQRPELSETIENPREDNLGSGVMSCIRPMIRGSRLGMFVIDRVSGLRGDRLGCVIVMSSRVGMRFAMSGSVIFQCRPLCGRAPSHQSGEAANEARDDAEHGHVGRILALTTPDPASADQLDDKAQ
jgi:hypothetical protein